MHSKIYLNLFFGGWGAFGGGVLLGLGLSLVGMIVKGMKWNECYRTFRFVATKKKSSTIVKQALGWKRKNLLNNINSFVS
jgi:hypothetical protein